MNIVIGYFLFQIWSLKIKFVNSSDSGWYECQISTHPPKLRLLKLTVVSKYQSPQVLVAG